MGVSNDASMVFHGTECIHAYVSLIEPFGKTLDALGNCARPQEALDLVLAAPFRR